MDFFKTKKEPSLPLHDDILDDKIWPTTADNYTFLAEVGTGAFATCYLAYCDTIKEKCAIKILELELFENNYEEIKKEIKTMSMLHHKNVVRCLCSFVSGHELWLIMPFLDAGSCSSIMNKYYPNGLKDDSLLATILRDALTGLAYFHSDGRIHRDIKAGNILISSSGTVQLADFGVAGSILEIGDKSTKRKTFVGTPCWMAPEVMENTNGYDQKADIWSFGITALELAFGHPPYSNLQPMKIMLKILNEAPPSVDTFDDFSGKFSQSFRDMIKICLQKDPAARPTAKELLKHKFFSKHGKDSAYIEAELIKKHPKLVVFDTSKPFTRCDKTKDPKCGMTHEQKYKPFTIDCWDFPSKEERFAACAIEPVDIYGTGDVIQSCRSRFEMVESPAEAITQSCRRFQIADESRFEISDEPRFEIADEPEAPVPVEPSRRRFVVEDA